MVDAVFQGCRYANAATDIAEHDDINMKYAGNIFPCRLPNWCLGKYLPDSKGIYENIIKVYTLFQ
jgi:hypothetical protein